ncbi:hypothetical protein D3C80_306790 [compost metagenome]
MKYLSRYLLIALVVLSQISCDKDDTLQDTRAISEIGVVFNEIKDPIVNMDKNQVLTIDPVITQTEKDKELTYEWEVNYKVFSTEKKLVYPCSKIGTYTIRLNVSNADGSTFKSFKLNVNSAYEEGLLVLTEDENGEGDLAFMRKFSQAEIADGKVESFVNNCFTLNNPGLKLGKAPTDIAKRLQQVYITSKGEKKVYLINNKTFELEATVAAPDIPGFKPLKINVPDNLGRSAVVLCEQGKIYNLAVLEFLVSPDTKYPTNVIEKTTFGFDLNDTYHYFWDNTTSKIHQVSAYSKSDSKTEFQGRNMVQFFYADAPVYADAAFYVISHSSENPSIYSKTVYSKNLSTIKEKTDLTGGIASALNSNSILEVNTAYKKLLYTNGNKIYSWFYTGTDSPVTAFITVDEGVITGMTQSTDGKLLYVGLYNASASGLKGSIYVYNMDTGALIAKHVGVMDKPVKLFYKKKD